MLNEKDLKNHNKLSPIIGTWAIAAVVMFFSGCLAPANETANRDANSANVNSSANKQADAARKPIIEVSPVEAGEGDYRIITNDSVQLTVRAPEAQEIELFYQPVTAADRAVKLNTLNQKSGEDFITELKAPEDFNGEVWARVRYPDGETKVTERLKLAARTASEAETNNETAQNQTNSAANTNNSATTNQTNQEQTADTDDSARSDKLTGGKIESAALKPDDQNVRITVNVPAFLLTLWQDGKEVKTYPVGVGRKAFPIPIGLRSADKIILNPNWVPPDSEWVRESGIEPYQKIPASDPDNPLGKIKIPLGNAYLLHEAQSRADLGNLVSHGCVRVLREDIFDLTEKIVTARNLEISNKEIGAAKKNSERRVIDLNGTIPVDINYDTMVVENGKLRIYPDVYDRGTNTTEKLRSKLESYGVDVARLDEKTLKEMLDKPSDERQFVVSISDIKAGNALAKGRTELLVEKREDGGKKSSSNRRSSE